MLPSMLVIGFVLLVWTFHVSVHVLFFRMSLTFKKYVLVEARKQTKLLLNLKV